MSFKIGDTVKIVNLNGGLLGKIGHVGKIVDISKPSGYFVLEPSCVGRSWPASALALVKIGDREDESKPSKTLFNIEDL